MSDTTTELKLDHLITQQRVIIQQNDKILEFVDVIHGFMGNLLEAFAENAAPDVGPQEPDAASAEGIAEILKALQGDDDEPKETSWGRSAYEERQREAESGD